MDIGIKFRAHVCSPITGNKVVFKNAVNRAREPPWLKLQTQQASVKLGGPPLIREGEINASIQPLSLVYP